MHIKHRMTQLRISAIVLVLACLAIGSVKENKPPGRLKVTILGFANKTGNPEAEHWRYGIERLLSSELKEIKTIKLGGGIEYARRQSGIIKSDPLTPEQARIMGELIEAQRVIWGSFHRQNEQWQVQVRVLNVADGKTTGELTATSDDWFELRDELIKQILEELDIIPSEQERQKMGRRWTTSTDALEWYSRTTEIQEESRPLSEQEECARKAAAADPQFARAHIALAATLGMQGQFAPAEQAARKALSLMPDYADTHRILGYLSLFTKNYSEAEREFREAYRLDPDDARALVRLAELYALQHKWDETIDFAEKARLIEPIDASIHAFLGFIYTLNNRQDEAMVELNEAQRFDPEDTDVLQRVGQAYEAMGEVPLAVENYERLLIQAKQWGVNPREVRHLEEKIQKLKASLTPTFIEAAMPKIYTEQLLQQSLAEKLTEDEMAMLVNPIASNDQMKLWTEELTEGADSDLDKARALFDALTGRTQPGGGRENRTAQEVFAAWNEPNVSFNCKEYTNLFIALAREIKLNVFYVHLEKDYKGKVIYHDCAILFAGDKALLVDPSYRWFGVPHKDFVILDDLQAIAHHFFQHEDAEPNLARCQLAAKLHPDFAWGQVCLAGALCKAQKFDEARKALNVAMQLEPGRWDVNMWLGLLAIMDKNLEEASVFLRKSLEQNTESAAVHFHMANILAMQGKLKEARDEFRASLRYDPKPEEAEQVHQAIAQINERIGFEISATDTNEPKINHTEQID